MDRKSLGAYYTPDALASWMCRWAVRRSGESVLDPACGDGVFLVQAGRLTNRLTGIDIDRRACDRARKRVSAHIICGDLFATQIPPHDVVVGNPPFVRFQRYRPEIARRFGLSPLASSWAPFVLRSAQLARRRMAMLVPREALFANYARPVLQRLRDEFAQVQLIALDDYLFEGTLAKVAVLLCERSGERTFVVREAGSLQQLDRPGAAAQEWMWARVPRVVWPAVREALEMFVPLRHVARVHTGVVTGDKSFFMRTRQEARRLGMKYFVEAVTTPMQLRGARFTRADFARLEGQPVHMFAYQDERVPPELADYLDEGIRRGVHLGYKCRNRRPWWKLRLGRVPDAFLGYLIMAVPKFAANHAGVRCTNNLHAVDFSQPVEIAAWYNYATLVTLELVGRVCADGALKIEPCDADRIRVPALPPDPNLARQIDHALRQGRTADAFELASRAAGLSKTQIRELRLAYESLRDARCLRTRRLTKTG